MPAHLRIAATLAVFAATGFLWMLLAKPQPTAGTSKQYSLAIATGAQLPLWRRSHDEAHTRPGLACRRLATLGRLGIGTQCAGEKPIAARIAEAD